MLPVDPAVPSGGERRTQLRFEDMRLLPPLVIRADERRRVKAVRQSSAATQTAA